MSRRVCQAGRWGGQPCNLAIPKKERKGKKETQTTTYYRLLTRTAADDARCEYHVSPHFGIDDTFTSSIFFFLFATGLFLTRIHPTKLLVSQAASKRAQRGCGSLCVPCNPRITILVHRPNGPNNGTRNHHHPRIPYFATWANMSLFFPPHRSGFDCATNVTRSAASLSLSLTPPFFLRQCLQT